jgi:hypothetical protein
MLLSGVRVSCAEARGDSSATAAKPPAVFKKRRRERMIEY